MSDNDSRKLESEQNKIKTPKNEEELVLKRQNWMSKITDLTGPVPLGLPPFREINHWIILIDENARLSYRTPRCSDVL